MDQNKKRLPVFQDLTGEPADTIEALETREDLASETCFSGQEIAVPLVSEAPCAKQNTNSEDPERVESVLKPKYRVNWKEETSYESSEEEEYRGLKKQPLDEIERLKYVIRKNDPRTTVMVKNIPNKYSKKMLLQTLDSCFLGQYDFMYLPIDFKNKCNVGYAFVNFLSPHVVFEFYELFNGKRWKKFNSDKICDVSYARLQGFYALFHHFQNSSIMKKESSKYKPFISLR